MLYCLMNKEKIVATFNSDDNGILNFDAVYDILPLGFNNIDSWLKYRNAKKYNYFASSVLRQLGCIDNVTYINKTHCISTNDTYWMKRADDEVQWNDVSPFRNNFTREVSNALYKSVELLDKSKLKNEFVCSPELSCEGSFRKRYRRFRDVGQFNSNIYVTKRGSEWLNDYECYSEYLASDVASTLNTTPYVCYDLVKNSEGGSASNSNIFTTEDVGFVPFFRIVDCSYGKAIDLASDFYMDSESEQQYREMLILDALIFNTDRHLGNFGVLINNYTQEVLRMAPTFDFNLSLLYSFNNLNSDNINDAIFDSSSLLGNDFTSVAKNVINDVIRDKLKDMKDFKFAFRGDEVYPSNRIKLMEEVINKHASKLLSTSNSELLTTDVFVSNKHRKILRLNENFKKCEIKLDKLYKIASDLSNNENIVITMCSDLSSVCLFVEYDNVGLTIDLLNGKIYTNKDNKICTLEDVKEVSESFYDYVISLLKNVQSIK